MVCDVSPVTMFFTLTYFKKLVSTTAVYFVPNYSGLYSVKVLSTENSVQRLRNKKLNKTKCDFLGQIRLVTSPPDPPPPPPPLGGEHSVVWVNIYWN